jgi:hypothetical protein
VYSDSKHAHDDQSKIEPESINYFNLSNLASSKDYNRLRASSNLNDTQSERYKDGERSPSFAGNENLKIQT